jgi:PhzF family phenazine biosynthesis protein
MRLRLYHVDAFTDFAPDKPREAKSGTRPPAPAGGRVTDRLFSGNPAGVVVLDRWLPDRLMQSIAAENNMSETAFVVPEGRGFSIRWFTPLTEVALCGHATLASAHVLFNHLGHASETISFRTRRSGVLKASREGDRIVLDFPADKLRKAPAPAGLSRALGRKPVGTWRGRTDLLCLFRSPKDIEGLRPDFAALSDVRTRGVIATAPGRSVDFVSRFFGPAVGVPEDPVTGSAHTTLAVFWAPRLGKTVMEAAQLSKRGGRLRCTLDGRRVKIAGTARTYLVGDIDLFQEDLA